jgi:hypothetical protein
VPSSSASSIGTLLAESKTPWALSKSYSFINVSIQWLIMKA